MEDKKGSSLRRHASSSEVDNSHHLRYPQFAPISPTIREMDNSATTITAATNTSANTVPDVQLTDNLVSDLRHQHQHHRQYQQHHQRGKLRRRRRTDHVADHYGHQHQQQHPSGHQRSSLPAEFSFATSATSLTTDQAMNRPFPAQTRSQRSLMSSDSDEYEVSRHAPSHAHNKQHNFRLNGRKRSLYEQCMPSAMLSSTGSDVGDEVNDPEGVSFAATPATSTSSSSDDEVRQLLFPVLVVREPLCFHSSPPAGMRHSARTVPPCLFLADRLCIHCHSNEECECTLNIPGQSAYKRIRCNSRLRPSLDLEKMQVR